MRFLNFGCFSQEMKYNFIVKQLVVYYNSLIILLLIFRLSFDRNTSQYSSSDDDIIVTVPGFGDTNTVERLSTGLIPVPYFKEFVEHFVERGYVRGKNIRAAPYDWRLAPGN